MEEVIKLSANNSQQYLKLETINRILDPTENKYSKKYCSAELTFAKRVAVGDSVHYMPTQQILNERKDSRDWRLVAYIAQEGTKFIDPETLKKLATQPGYGRALFDNCKDLPPELLTEVLLTPKSLDLRKSAAKWCKGKDIPDPVVKKLLASCQHEAKAAALYSYLGKDTSILGYSKWQKVLDQEYAFFKQNKQYKSFVYQALVESFAKAPELPEELLREWLNDGDWLANKLIMDSIAQREDHANLLYKGLRHVDIDVKRAAAKAFRKKRLSIEEIDKLRKQGRWEFRAAAMYAAAGRKELPSWWITERLDDFSEDVVIAARTAAEDRADIPPARVIEPKGNVYKRCLGDVIVVAKIPDTADIRGGKYKYRANQAEIVDIIGDLFGEKVGVSTYDGKTQYRIGDQVQIKDFDHSDEVCSTGFHFFLTKKETRSFIPF